MKVYKKLIEFCNRDCPYCNNGTGCDRVEKGLDRKEQWIATPHWCPLETADKQGEKE